mmetsp:Transcript_68186/g.120612  ORF Transcript_68186/g.120612 Transcript_68186/m.120612 type:complete len:273 (+) Transcript_68186:265-1083(+)
MRVASAGVWRPMGTPPPINMHTRGRPGGEGGGNPHSAGDLRYCNADHPSAPMPFQAQEGRLAPQSALMLGTVALCTHVGGCGPRSVSGVSPKGVWVAQEGTEGAIKEHKVSAGLGGHRLGGPRVRAGDPVPILGRVCVWRVCAMGCIDEVDTPYNPRPRPRPTPAGCRDVQDGGHGTSQSIQFPLGPPGLKCRDRGPRGLWSRWGVPGAQGDADQRTFRLEQSPLGGAQRATISIGHGQSSLSKGNTWHTNYHTLNILYEPYHTPHPIVWPD